jgi:hypothetical protein
MVPRPVLVIGSRRRDRRRGKSEAEQRRGGQYKSAPSFQVREHRNSTSVKVFL